MLFEIEKQKGQARAGDERCFYATGPRSELGARATYVSPSIELLIALARPIRFGMPQWARELAIHGQRYFSSDLMKMKNFAHVGS